MINYGFLDTLTALFSVSSYNIVFVWWSNVNPFIFSATISSLKSSILFIIILHSVEEMVYNCGTTYSVWLAYN